jgi:multiple sugar transport system permease protein
MSNVNADTVGMEFLESTPRKLVTVYLPLAVFLFVLLFPFYWMAITSFKPNNELLSREGNPFWVIEPTLAHVKKLLFDTAYPQWMWNTVLVSRVPSRPGWRSSWPTWCHRRSCSFRWPRWCSSSACSTRGWR